VAADLVVLECQQRGTEVFRFNTEDYPVNVGMHLDPSRADTALLLLQDDSIALGRCRGIWIRRPQWPVIDPRILEQRDRQLASQEAVAAMGGAWRVLADRCVSPPDALQAARWKLGQLATASALGFDVPQTIVTSDPARARDFASTGEVVLKAVADARVTLSDEEYVGLTTMLEPGLSIEEVQFVPTMLQRVVPKVADLRLTVVGDELFPVTITAPPGSPLDFRAVPSELCDYRVIALPDQFSDRCIQFLRHYGLRFGAFDFVMDDRDQFWFLECNPAGQWGWLEAFTDVRITSALVDLLLGQ
jgi:MvdD pre-ATP grasp domain